MITTEKATTRYDLPHAVEIADWLTNTCKCSRYAEHEIHKAALRETAGQQPVLVTEKGS